MGVVEKNGSSSAGYKQQQQHQQHHQQSTQQAVLPNSSSSSSSSHSSASGKLADFIRAKPSKPVPADASRPRREPEISSASWAESSASSSVAAPSRQAPGTSSSSSSSKKAAASATPPVCKPYVASSKEKKGQSASASSSSAQRPADAVAVTRHRPGEATTRRFVDAAYELLTEEGEEAREDAAQEQLDELETLRAIYGDALSLLGADGKVIPMWREGAGVEEVRWPVWFRLQLPVELSSSGGEEKIQLLVRAADGQNNCMIVAGSVETLPPLSLYCALPKGYPLDTDGPSPALAVFAEHLGEQSEASGQLEEELERLFEERAGEQLLFELASLLQERATLASNQLVLGEGAAAAAMGMQRALELLAVDARARDEKRQQQLHTCPVCFDDVLGSRGLFLGCGHFGCRSCLEQMASLHTGESDIGALRCPNTDCREPLGIHVLQDLLGADSPLLAKWEELSLQRCLEKMGDVVFCPRCDRDADSTRVPCIQDEDGMAQCDACGFVFCGRCREVYHPGSKCVALDSKLEALAAGRGKEAEAAKAELLTLRQLERSTKPCPQCGTNYEKTEGCSKMHCKVCDNNFCWRCGKIINGYDHFATGACRLFDDEEVRRWNQEWARMEAREARVHEARFLQQFINFDEMRDQLRKCPQCKSDVFKEGKNNHLRCVSCWTPFCGKCGVVLPKRKPGEHFQRGGCPQHSD